MTRAALAPTVRPCWLHDPWTAPQGGTATTSGALGGPTENRQLSTEPDVPARGRARRLSASGRAARMRWRRDVGRAGRQVCFHERRGSRIAAIRNRGEHDIPAISRNRRYEGGEKLFCRSLGRKMRPIFDYLDDLVACGPDTPVPRFRGGGGVLCTLEGA